MCIYAMDEQYSMMNYQSGDEPNFIQALNELLKIECSTFTYFERYNTELPKIVDWINKYAGNRLFTKDKSTIKEWKADKYLADLEEARGSLHLSSSWRTFEKDLIRNLNSMSIKHIDAQLEEESSYLFENLDLIDTAGELRTIIELYLFMKGEPLYISLYEIGERVLLPLNIIGSVKDFFPLSKISVYLEKSFAIDKSYKEILGVSNQTLERFAPKTHNYKFSEAYSNKTKETLNKEDCLGYYPIDKNDKRFGEKFYRLATEIICAYLDKYSSYEVYLKQRFSTHVFDRKEERFKEKSPDEEPNSLLGFIRLRTTLANAILNSRVFKCEQCCQPFVAKRPDAKTCSDLCRNHLSQENRFKKKYNIQ